MARWKSATGKSRNTQKHFTTRLVNALTGEVPPDAPGGRLWEIGVVAEGATGCHGERPSGGKGVSYFHQEAPNSVT